MQNMEFCWHQQILVISYQSIITYCFLAVWTCINLRRIWLWPPLSPRFPGAALLPLHPQSNLFHKTSLDIELMFLLSNKHLDFIENLKHSFHNFVYYKSVFVAPIWKALWICREQGPMFIVFLWPFSINCLSNFFIKFQFVLGPAMASWGNLLSSKPVKDSTKTFLRFAAFGLRTNCESMHDVSATLFWLFQYLRFTSIWHFCKFLLRLSSNDIENHGESLIVHFIFCLNAGKIP